MKCAITRIGISWLLILLATGCGENELSQSASTPGSAGAGGVGTSTAESAGIGAAGGGGEVGSAGLAGAGTGQGGGATCLDATAPCQADAECCSGLSCGTTTLGEVCCGMDGAPCATANGEDCCGDLLCVAGTCLAPGAPPTFQAPFPCGESWTYSHHSGEVRRALDFINDSGATDGSPVLAAAAGTATQHYEAGGAGNYIAVEHGGGWKTYYFHLQAFSVDDGAAVTQGQEVGLVGSTGASSGPHLHFEELLDGTGMDIWLDAQVLAPYPEFYNEQSVTSANCPAN